MRGAAYGLIVSHLLLFVAAFQAPAPAGNLLHTECGVNQQRNCGQFRTRCRANRNPAFCFRRSVSQSLSHSTAVHMNAGGVAGGSDAATQDEIATRIRLIWELEDAVQSRDFIKAQELQSKLRRIFALREDELLPIGKDAFKGKVILVAGGNGRLGSQVVRELLRRGCSVRATIRSSDAVRDYARLSYEIGAEEGLGEIVAPWVRKSVQMTATAQMGAYGLGRLTVVECDLMDETSVAAAMRDVDSVIWCATDFDGGRPKLEAPDRRARDEARAGRNERKKAGTVDVEGVGLGARLMKQEARRAALIGRGPGALRKKGDPVKTPQFVLVSAREGALPLDSFPPGTVERLKRSGEALLMREGPQDSIVLRFGAYAFDDPRPRPPSTVTPSSLGFTSSANGNRKEKEEQEPPPTPPPPLASVYTCSSNPIAAEEDSRRAPVAVARGMAARIVALAAVAVGFGGGGGEKEEGGREGGFRCQGEVKRRELWVRGF